jgi:hypothetical protein
MIYSLNSLFKQVGLSRQGFHQMLHRQRRVGEQNAYLSVLIARIREEHLEQPCYVLQNQAGENGSGCV